MIFPRIRPELFDQLRDKVVLVTGGTGSFGRAFCRRVLEETRPRKLIVFSRDELKQFEMAQDPFMKCHDKVMRYYLGDVRDKDRLRMAFAGVNIAIHAAALKQIPATEYNPFEAVKTNVLGAQNVIEAALDCDVEQVVTLSTDKAANPINLYGATKLCADKLFIAANSYSAATHPTRFSIVRYGNVMGSRGSVILSFLEQRKNGKLEITHPDMTRFWITLERGIEVVLEALQMMGGGEVFVPKLPSMRLVDLARAISVDSEHVIVGIRPGEKLHEVMIPVDEARNTLEFDRHYRIMPHFFFRESLFFPSRDLQGGTPVPEDFLYSSDRNSWWLSEKELMQILREERDDL